MENTHNHDLEVITFPIDFMCFHLQQFGDEFTTSVEVFGHQVSVDQHCAEVEAEFSRRLDKDICFDDDNDTGDNDNEEVPQEWKE